MRSLEASIQNDWPIASWGHSTTIVGVSGGPDSVALLHALRSLAQSSTRLIVAHIDHGLRGVESDGDRTFVQQLAADWGLVCETVQLSGPASAIRVKPNEESLRRARHHHLREIATKHAASWIATAHHADDVVETLLHHLLRGSGPRGLASIALKRQIRPGLTLVRPLLSVPRSTIMEYLSEHRLPFRVDQSNASPTFTRNRIRHELLPYLRDFVGNSHLDQRLWQTAQQLRDEHSIIEKAATTWLEQAGATELENSMEFPKEVFANQDWCILREGLVRVWHDRSWPLREMSYQHWSRLSRFLQQVQHSPHPCRLQLPGSIEVQCRRGRVRFVQHADAADQPRMDKP
ncbi:MAG: tRNA lysidine(34) synthetase TilS [Pirellula sp.]|jgi:tRNA(Ile)-lysidine synthase|nr:tRNA lysidine(34) synthetase TilS [Pirellula sp.]